MAFHAITCNVLQVACELHPEGFYLSFCSTTVSHVENIHPLFHVNSALSQDKTYFYISECRFGSLFGHFVYSGWWLNWIKIDKTTGEHSKNKQPHNLTACIPQWLHSAGQICTEIQVYLQIWYKRKWKWTYSWIMTGQSCLGQVKGGSIWWNIISIEYQVIIFINSKLHWCELCCCHVPPTVSLPGSARPLGPARRIKRPPQYPTRCPYWDGFRWSQRAARERSESHSGLNWTHHETGSGRGSVQHRPAHRQGLFQLRLTLVERGITTGFRVAGHIWTQHMVSQSAPGDYMAQMWQTETHN